MSAAPALAATTEPGGVPYCSGGVTQLDLKNGTYAQELQRPGATVNSVEVWNGCIKVIYTNASGNTRVAFYDPSSLQRVDIMRDNG
jgi:streptogramin lyase